MKKLILIPLACLFIFQAYSQNNAPVAVDDTIEAICQVPVLIDPLANDYDPDGDSIFIENTWNPNHGQISILDGMISYTSWTYTGEDNIRYQIVDDGNPPASSPTATVYIHVLPNPHMPVAVYESYELPELEQAELDVMSNDYDPDGDVIKISSAGSSNACQVSLNADSTRVFVTPGFASNGRASFYYTLVERGTGEKLKSVPTTVYIKIRPNPDIPVLVADTAYTTGGIPVTIPVLANDYDLQGEEFIIFGAGGTSSGTVQQDGDNLIFTPFISFEGKARFRYNVWEIYDPNIYSEYQWCYVYVSKNPACPLANPDYASGVIAQPIIIDVLANDTDPNGENLSVYDVDAGGDYTIEDNKIIYTPASLSDNKETIWYRAIQTDHPEYYSDWTPVYLTLSHNPDFPEAVDDYIAANIYYPVTIAPMANDIANTADSLEFFIPSNMHCDCYVEKISDSLLTYQALTNSNRHDTVVYYISDKYNTELQAYGKIIVELEGNHYYDSLDINKINAGISADGLLFADAGQLPGNGIKSNYRKHFLYPADAQTSTIFNSMLWIGGMTESHSLCFAGERYRQQGADFQPGPVADSYDTIYARKYRRLWKLGKEDIEYHRYNWWKEGYVFNEDILTWPGNGDTTKGQALQLAPFYDTDNDGIYEPLTGDYPLIRGDEAIFFMMNDDKEHTESMGDRMKAEIHGMVYGFDAPQDSALAHTIFVHFDLINRSENIYFNTYAGIRTDLDIGAWYDDYTGADVMRNSYYSYNGDNYDEDGFDPYYGDVHGYKSEPPAQSCTVLAGPFLDANGVDDAAGECDFSTNGLNFGNGINDDERYGLTGFWAQISSDPEPPEAPEMYNRMKSTWDDGTSMQYGGAGYADYLDPRVVGPECNFFFPGASDPHNIGTGCAAPNAPYSQDGFFWTDSNTNVPGDRTGLGSMGPFTFRPGDIQEIDLAYVVANGWYGPLSSVDELMEYIDTLQARVQKGGLIVSNDQLGVDDVRKSEGRLKIYPNPASEFVIVDIQGIDTHCEYAIYDLFGSMVATGTLSSQNQNTLNINGLKAGLYILMINSDDTVHSGKIVVQ